MSFVHSLIKNSRDAEVFACRLLSRVLNIKFDVSNKPDLRSLNCGIEVTSAVPQWARNPKVLDQGVQDFNNGLVSSGESYLVSVSDEFYSRCKVENCKCYKNKRGNLVYKIEQVRIDREIKYIKTFADGRHELFVSHIGGISVSDCVSGIVDCIRCKVNKLTSGGYEVYSENSLFVYALVPEFIVISYMCTDLLKSEIDYKKFDRIFICSCNLDYLFEIKTCDLSYNDPYVISDFIEL